MTIVFAMREYDNSVLIGADTQRTDDAGIKDKKHKLQCIPNSLVAWACAGNDDLGNRFTRWLQDYQWPPASWDSFEQVLQTTLADLNGQQRALTKRSGAEWNKDYGVSCLLVAWLNDECHIEGYDDDGLKVSFKPEGCGAIGSGRAHAIIAYRTLEGIKGPDAMTKFVHILQIAARHAPGCEEPVDIWRIRSDGIDQHPFQGEVHNAEAAT